MAYESNWNRDRRNAKVGRPVRGDGDTTARDAALRLWGDRPALVFGRWTSPRPAATIARLIWDRRDHGSGDLAMPWGPTDEEIYVLGSVSRFVGRRGSNVLRVPRLASGSADRPAHPTPKPIPLMESLIGHTTGAVADPFAGSGSTLVAAKLLGRTAVGVEIEERYCEMAARRLDQGVLAFG
jgi:site-specific DNA-methyltransferase (adenine-specific)